MSPADPAPVPPRDTPSAGVPHRDSSTSPVEIDYTNYRGERGVRTIIPTDRLLPGGDTYHPDARWLIEAWDLERGVMRTFDPAKIHRWGDQQAHPDAGRSDGGRTEVGAVLAAAPTLEQVAEVVHDARWKPEDAYRRTPFAVEDRNGREYCLRIASAILARFVPGGLFNLLPPGARFRLGDRLRKVRGSSWQGRVVGYYSTALTPIGYVIESEREAGSVQVYPEGALEPVPEGGAGGRGGAGEGWQPIETAPYGQEVDVRVGTMRFRAKLVQDGSIDADGKSCDQWQATREGAHPPCWSDGACWENNEDLSSSLQPDAWRPLPSPPTPAGEASHG